LDNSINIQNKIIKRKLFDKVTGAILYLFILKSEVETEVFMIIHVKLFGTLQNFITDYDPERGKLIELPSSATAADLLTYMGIPLSKKPLITCNERILKTSDTIEANTTLHILQPISGG
jgi:hypothetical protein